MRVKKKTIKLAKIRRLIRQAIEWNLKDDGMPLFYDKPKSQWKFASPKKGTLKNVNYYTRSSLAIREIAEKIYKECRK